MPFRSFIPSLQPAHLLYTALLGFLILPAGKTLAQDNEDDSTVVYPAEYFTEWTPITAQDMLERIPGQESGGGRRTGGPPGGFGGNPASGGRGLGGGNSGVEILVNGKRAAGKNNDTSSQLGRIAANQVREIQVIRGTSGELDVRGSRQVINVILFEELASSNLSYDARMVYVQDDTVQPNGSVSLSGRRGNLDYLFSLGRQARYRNTLNNESSVLGDISPNDTVLEERTQDTPNTELSVNLGYEIGANSSLRVNGLYGINDGITDIDRVTTGLTGPVPTYLVEREGNPQEQTNWELGGDYELTMDSGGRFKLLAIANKNDRTNIRERFQVFPDGNEQKNLFINSQAITQERIARASLTYDVFGGQNVEFGVEGAQTLLDSGLAIGTLNGSGTPSDAVGGLVPAPLPNANSQVEEIRYEPFVIHNWNLNSQMTLESQLIYETSEINQTGDVTRSRSFEFIKPKVDLRYDVSAALQLRGTVERLVNQLSFADFVASNDSQDEDSNAILGNADLRQQTQWKYSFNTEYRFPNDVGVVNVELFHARHEDVIDFIDLSTTGDLRSIRGNIGDGWETVMDINGSVRGVWFGMPNLLLSPGFTLQDSEVTDPFLGIKRRFRFYNRGQFRFTFRHDIPELRTNWGMQYFDRLDGGMFSYDVSDFEFTVGEPRVNFYAEYIDPRGLTVRFDVGAITDGAQCRERYRFNGHIANGDLRELEYRCSHTGVETALQISGTF